MRELSDRFKAATTIGAVITLVVAFIIIVVGGGPDVNLRLWVQLLWVLDVVVLGIALYEFI
jgi:hypothetical protein